MTTVCIKITVTHELCSKVFLFIIKTYITEVQRDTITFMVIKQAGRVVSLDLRRNSIDTIRCKVIYLLTILIRKEGRKCFI